ncbi:cysteine-rich receptor-like protein kinase 29 [Momordica charantia]|uniref:Cysteine-rich receptor-like protein kinase 29 n=1 Tax=Momordica charantia TaxID=3673 RepID=A0A6J1CLX3_MOMCH|nr:cysteine-rich receptor-like protein kinase 29 [Momordica charantia]
MAFFLPLALFFFVRVCTSQPAFLYHVCGNSGGSFTSNSTYKANLDHVLSFITTTKDTGNGFYNFSYGQSSDSANAIGLCRGDVDPDVCRNCLNDSIYVLKQNCPKQKEAIGWYDNCMLRYSNRPIFGAMEVDPKLLMLLPSNNVAQDDLFSQNLRTLFDGLKKNASSGGSLKKYAAGYILGPGLGRIYALLQCTPDLSQSQCDVCLDTAFKATPPCCRKGLRSFLPSCNFRYDTSRFFDLSDYSPPPALVFTPSTHTISTEGMANGKKNNTKKMVIIVVLPFTALLVLATGIYAFLRSRKLRERLETSDDEISPINLLQYDFKTIRDATNDFSISNKLGQGGFGLVYKGKLFNGLEVAVKRLARGSQQGDSEFKNEVLLVAKLQHRNLVRLLGFCFERNERLLIYEFLVNSSLDRFIFDPIQRQYLDWLRRYKIIVGISRGLMYLHEDSRFKVIHQDLKSSNILLDAELNPKITDFGMARLCSINQSHGDTSRIKGTYGYMAPEYALYGHFSVKSDVFSFGVLLLEIISGQKNSCFQDGENTEHLLTYTWKNWMEGTVTNIIDPILARTCIDEIVKCIHLGLLCVQENVASRPTMASVVLMLNSNSLTLPVPSRPGFFLQSNTSNLPQHFDYTEGSQPSRSESIYIEEEESLYQYSAH